MASELANTPYAGADLVIESLRKQLIARAAECDRLEADKAELVAALDRACACLTAGLGEGAVLPSLAATLAKHGGPR